MLSHKTRYLPACIIAISNVCRADEPECERHLLDEATPVALFNFASAVTSHRQTFTELWIEPSKSGPDIEAIVDDRTNKTAASILQYESLGIISNAGRWLDLRELLLTAREPEVRTLLHKQLASFTSEWAKSVVGALEATRQGMTLAPDKRVRETAAGLNQVLTHHLLEFAPCIARADRLDQPKPKRPTKR